MTAALPAANDSAENSRRGIKILVGFTIAHGIFHFGLLWAVGIVASPLMGHLSDRLGRKPVLVPALLCSGALTVILALFGKGIMFTVIIGMLGIFLRSDYALLSAAILDIVGQKVATTVLGVLSFLRFSMAAISPLIAGYLYQNFGMKAVLFFTAALFAISAAIFASADLKKSPDSDIKPAGE